MSIKISLHIYYPKASFTGPIAALNKDTCSNSASFNLFCKFLFGFYSVLSDKIRSLSIGILNCFNAFNCSSLFGYPMIIYPLISFNFPKWFIYGIRSFSKRSYGGGVFGLYSSAFLSFFFAFLGAGFFYYAYWFSVFPPSSVF